MSKLWIGDKVYIVDEEVQAEVDRLIDVEAERDRLLSLLGEALPALKAAYGHGTSLSIGKRIMLKVEQALTPDIKQT